MDEDELPEALAALLAPVVDDASVEVADFRRLSGGASRQTWAFRLVGSDRSEPLVLQRERPGPLDAGGAMEVEASLLAAAAAEGVPVAPLVVTHRDADALGAPYLVSRFVDGETIARKILRDERFASARADLAAECGRALAAVHRIPTDAAPGLENEDQLTRFRAILDALGQAHPAFELAFRWLDRHRPATAGTAVVHGDFRLGNLIVDERGLRAVIDWELAHLGDPMEDLGWLCVKAWRFGGELPVGGFGTYEQLFDAYEAAGGGPVDPEVVAWWQMLGTLKWGIMCIIQAATHLSGTSRSVELAAIGRRVCENEADLLEMLP